MKLRVDIEKRLDSFCLEVCFETDGKVLGILGASGSGKSLTLKCIAGIETPDKGRIVLGDRVLFDSSAHVNLSPQVRRTGYLFQDYALFPTMDVRHNIMCGGISQEECDDYIRRFHLKGKERLKPAALSGGEKQRTAIARMLAAKPDIIMFDEPFSALDSHLKKAMEKEIRDVIDDYGGQALFVSHDIGEICRLADEIAVMDMGRTVEVQNKQEFFSAPKSVAGALLTGNLGSIQEL